LLDFGQAVDTAALIDFEIGMARKNFAGSIVSDRSRESVVADRWLFKGPTTEMRDAGNP
jgi:hypothetical protein